MAGARIEVTRSFRAMNTDVQIILLVEPSLARRTAQRVLDAVARLFALVEAVVSRFRPDSELSALNRSAGKPFAASPLLFAAVSAAVEAARATGGLFDPTVLPALVASGYDRSFELLGDVMMPDVPLPHGVTPGQWHHIHLDPRRRTITLPADSGLDLGGIAKGWTVDYAVRLLAACGFRHYAIDAGGDLYVAGRQADGTPWPVGVEDPRAPGRDLVVLRLEDCAVATSSTCRRRWQQDGSTRHHLIDPRTGRPAESGVLAATVLASSVARAEVLAKVALLLGPEEGLRFLETQPDAAGLLVLERSAGMVRWPRTASLVMEAHDA